MNADTTMQPAIGAADAMETLLKAVPTWKSYLYQDFLLPAFSLNNATEWLNLNSPFGHTQPIPDYFSPAWNDANDNHFAPTPTPRAPTKADPQQWPQSPPQPVQQSGPSGFCTQPYYYNTSSSTSPLASLLVGPQYGQGSGSFRCSAAQSQDGLLAVDKINAELDRSPSTIDSLSTHVTQHLSSKLGQKSPLASLDPDVEHSHEEQEHEVPESVERDGLIWGMKVEDYRALSARERKRVRNRISARTFRAKRKQHLSSLESTLSGKDLQMKLAQEEASRLRKEVADLKRRLAEYNMSYDQPVA
ncbi:hypothetical protein EHS25_000933 [Saitozyma podzolica]|uniref:BZIP domain-containing protein n=1 Tax=Saitozyma podzolica TaxID=1890683 RepID=A0A427YXM9_9TREE|nr:hypothetical protein EHS25_000933 [Saitozyma podzolica]